MNLPARVRALERDRAARDICRRCGSGTWVTIRLVINGKEMRRPGAKRRTRCGACGRDLRPGRAG